MEEDGEESPRAPFWIQSTNVRRASSLFFNFGVLIILLLLFAVLSMVFIIPSVNSFTSHIFGPNSVKKRWDSLNLVLVLVALALGFLSKLTNNDQESRFNEGFDRSRSDLSTGAPVARPLSSTPHQWYDFREQPISGLRRHRSTSSYPDLREFSPSYNHRAEAALRFSDDTHLNSRRLLNDDQYYSSAPPPQPPISEKKSYSPSPQPPVPDDVSNYRLLQPPGPEDESYSPPPQSPAPRPSAKMKPIRTYHNVAAHNGENSRRSEFNEVLLPETDPPAFQDSERKGETIRKRGKGERRRARSSEPRRPVSPIDDPAPEPLSPRWMILPEFQDSDQITSGIERKRTGANATKRFFTSFYQKKKKRLRSLDNFDNLLRHSQPPVKFQLPPPSPPPPPPLPPPPSFLNNLFTSKKERRKKIASATPPPPPPPPPTMARASKPTTTRASPSIPEKRREPVKMSFFKGIDDSSSGGQSSVSGISTTLPPRHPSVPDNLFTSKKERRKNTASATPPPLPPPRAPKPTITRVSPFIAEKPRVPVKMNFFNGIDDFSSGGESPMNYRIPPPPPMPPFKMPDLKFAVEGDYVRLLSTRSSGSVSVSPERDEDRSPSSTMASSLFCPSPDVDTKADTFIARFRAGLKLEKINSFKQNQALSMSKHLRRPRPK